MKILTCIICPLGCKISVEKNSDGYTIKNNKCSRGYEYILNELTNPKRIVTSTVIIENGVINRLPVKTDNDVKKELIFLIIKEIDEIKVTAPVKTGDILKENILNTGVNIVATRDVKCKYL